MLFRKCKLTLLTRNIAHTEFNSSADRIMKRTLGRSITLPYSSLEPLLSEFYLHRFRLQVLLPMDMHTSSRRTLKLAQEQEVIEDQRRPRNKRQNSTCCRGCARHAAQNPSERQATSQ